MKNEYSENLKEYWLEIITPEKNMNTFRQIGGYRTIKNTLLEYVNLFNQIEKLKKWDLRIMGKILLHGPPGTGKTTLVKSLAKESNKDLIILNTTQIMSKYISETGKNLQGIFEKIKNNPNCIFFIDEFDSIAKTRSSTGDHDEMKRIVNTLLTAFDKINLIEHRILTIAATNFEIMLDDAVWRRFDEILYVNLPNADERADIFKVITKKIPYEILNFNPGSLGIIEATKNWSGGDLQRLVNRAVIDVLNNKLGIIKEKDILELINKKIVTPTSMRTYKPFYTLQEESIEGEYNRKSKIREMLESKKE